MVYSMKMGGPKEDAFDEVKATRFVLNTMSLRYLRRRNYEWRWPAGIGVTVLAQQ